MIHDEVKEAQILKEMFVLWGSFSAETSFVFPDLKSLSHSKDWFWVNYITLAILWFSKII